MWYLIVLIPDLCTLTYFVEVMINALTYRNLDYELLWKFVQKHVKVPWNQTIYVMGMGIWVYGYAIHAISDTIILNYMYIALHGYVILT